MEARRFCLVQARLNLPGEPATQAQACQVGGGQISMKSVQPDSSDPIPMRSPSPRMGTLMIRFIGLLVAAVVVLALIWSR